MSLDKVLQENEIKRQAMYQEYQKNIKLGLLLVIVLVGFYFLFKAASIASNYRKNFKDVVISDLVKDKYPDGTYNHNDRIDQRYIDSLNFYQRPDRHKGEDLITGSFNGVSFKASDVHMEERIETRDAKGNRQVSYQTIFKGRWYHFEFERRFEHILQVKEGRFSGAASRNLKKYETESILFNKKFKIFSSDQEYVFYQLTPVLIEKILEFEKMHRGSIQMMYHQNCLDIAVNDSSDSFEIKLKTPLTKENIGHILGDIDMPGAIINEFNLDSEKFTKK